MKEGWKMVKLGEVCEIFGRIGFRGYTTKDIVQSPKDGAISLSPSNIQNGKMDYSKCTYISWYKYNESPEIMISNGDILLVKTGSSYGKSALVEHLPHEATINPQSVVLKNFKIYNKFLAYQIRTKRIKDEFDKFVSGTAIPTFSQAKLSEVLICLPPLEEQHRIVSILYASFEKIDALKKNAEENLKNAKALFQQVLAQELKPKEGCEMAKLGDVCELKSGNSSANDSNDGHLAYVKVSDLNLEENKNCIVTSTKFVDRQQNLKNIFPVGSVIFPKRGGAILTNKKRLTSIEVCCDLNIMGVIPCTNLDSHYLFYYFQGLNLGKISSGTTIPQINNKDVSPLLIPLPVIEEQHRIVATLDTLSEKCRRLEQVAQQTIRECDALKQSILRQAFSGEL